MNKIAKIIEDIRSKVYYNQAVYVAGYEPPVWRKWTIISLIGVTVLLIGLTIIPHSSTDENANKHVKALGNQSISPSSPSTPIPVVSTTPQPAIVIPKDQPEAPAAPSPQSSNVYYANCTEARAAGAAPIYAGQPGYRSKLDRDGDGVACE